MKARNRVVRDYELPDAPEDGEYPDSGSIRDDRSRTREGSGIVGHHSRESFAKAVCKTRPGDLEPLPIPEGIGAREARRGLREAYGVTLASDAEQ